MFVWGIQTAEAQVTQSAPTKVEEQRLQEELRHNAATEQREWLTLAGGVIAAFYGLFRYFDESKKKRKEAEKAFHNELVLKAVELAMQAESPSRAESRLQIIKQILPALRESEDLKSIHIDQTKFGFGSSIKRRQELIALLAAAQTDRRRQILSDWHNAFPHDSWVFEEKSEFVLREQK